MTYQGNSIVDYLNSIGQPSDYASRVKLAQANGITDYASAGKNNASQNLALLGKLRNAGTTGSTSGGSLNGTMASPTITPAAPVFNPATASAATSGTTGATGVTGTGAADPTSPAGMGDFKAMLAAATRSAYNQGQTPSSILNDYHNAGVNIKDPSSMANVINFETNQRGGNIQDIFNGAMTSFDNYTKLNQQKVTEGTALFKTAITDNQLAPLLKALTPDELHAWATNGVVPQSFYAALKNIKSTSTGSGSGTLAPISATSTGGATSTPKAQTFAEWLKAKQNTDAISYDISNPKVLADLQSQFQQQTQQQPQSDESVDPAVLKKFDPTVQMLIRGDIQLSDLTPTEKQHLAPQLNQAYQMGIVKSSTAGLSVPTDVQAVLEGRETLQDIRQTIGKSNDAAAYMQSMRNAITKIDPNFDFIASNAGGKAVSAPYYQKAVAAIDAVEPNINKVVDLSNQVSRFGIAGVDNILQKAAIQIGDKKVASFREAQKILSDEIGLALGAGTVSDMKLQLGFDITNPSLSSEVFASNMGVVKEFIDNRKAALQGLRYKSATVTGAGQSNANGNFSVTDPTGVVHTFTSQASLDSFKKETGL